MTIARVKFVRWILSNHLSSQRLLELVKIHGFQLPFWFDDTLTTFLVVYIVRCCNDKGLGVVNISMVVLEPSIFDISSQDMPVSLVNLSVTLEVGFPGLVHLYTPFPFLFAYLYLGLLRKSSIIWLGYP